MAGQTGTPGSVTQTTTAAQDWTIPSGMNLAGVGAEVVFVGGETLEDLSLTAFNFSLPAGAIVTSIEVTLGLYALIGDNGSAPVSVLSLIYPGGASTINVSWEGTPM